MKLFGKSYKSYLNLIKKDKKINTMQYAIGGEFEAFGIIEREMLKFYGLKDGDFLIDVGCGSGRLAIPLSKQMNIKYLGTDVVSDLIEYAKEHTNRPDWKFKVVDDFQIPEKNSSADMICMFSVLTHLLHEHSYIYLEECKRVLKPGGKLVFSFLEFACPPHWAAFEATINDARVNTGHPLNVFIERNAIEKFCQFLGFEIIEFRDGMDRFVPMPHPVSLDNGTIIEDYGSLGQSICVLQKPQ